MQKIDSITVSESHAFSSTVELTKALIERPSITPNDAGCQVLLAEQLSSLGFSIEHLRINEVDNLWARLGTASPLFVFAGHTDVVPPGPLTEWVSPPFSPTVREGYLYGRGAADMKGSIAAMLTACQRFLTKHPNFTGSIAFLITSDEEGPAKDGTQKVLKILKERRVVMDYCLVGEPTSEEQLGDIMKVGRRGSLTGHLKIFGEQKHIAYADSKLNPIHQSFPALADLSNVIWDSEIPPFPKTSFHISNLHAGTHAGNIVPGLLECQFNFRFSPNVTAVLLQQRVEIILKMHHLHYELRWELFGLPFLTKPGKLRTVVKDAIKEILNIETEASASGGTSDARFIAQDCDQVIEFGPSRFGIHGINERVKVDDLDKLSVVYERILEKLLLG